MRAEIETVLENITDARAAARETEGASIDALADRAHDLQMVKDQGWMYQAICCGKIYEQTGQASKIYEMTGVAKRVAGMYAIIYVDILKPRLDQGATEFKIQEFKLYREILKVADREGKHPLDVLAVVEAMRTENPTLPASKVIRALRGDQIRQRTENQTVGVTRRSLKFISSGAPVQARPKIVRTITDFLEMSGEAIKVLKQARKVWRVQLRSAQRKIARTAARKAKREQLGRPRFPAPSRVPLSQVQTHVPPEE